jgi:hypothetical protein
VPGIYRPRHPERTVLYWVLLLHFEEVVAEYMESFERTYGYFRPIIKEVVKKYLDCGKIDKISFTRSPKFNDLKPIHIQPLPSSRFW